MVKKFLLRNVAMLLCLAMLITSTAKTTYGFIIVQSDPLVNTFVPTILPDEEVSVTFGIKKEVQNQNGGNIGPKDFVFGVSDITDSERTEIIAGNLFTDENGNTGFEIKYRKEDIGKTFTYKISEEKPAMEGMTYADDQTFTVAVTADGAGNIIATPSANQFTFVNTYIKPDTTIVPAPFTVNITKTVSGDSYSAEGFEFTVKNESGAVLGTATTDSEGKASVAFEISEAGTFEYIVSETDGGINGMDYADPQTITVTADVKNNKVVITSVNVAGEEVSDFSNGINLTFINKYEKPPVPTTSVKIDVSTTIKNNVPGTPLEDFEFVLKNSDGSGMPVSEFSDENGKASFVINGITAPAQGETKVLELDIIQYKDGRYPELVYDETVHKIKIIVTDENGDGIPEVKVTVDDIETNEVQFVNRYPGADEVSVLVNIEKIIENKTSLAVPSAEFNFEIVDSETGEVAAAAKISGSGRTSAELVFNKNNVLSNTPKTYTYHIREVEGTAEGFEYDEDFSTLQIVAKLDEDEKPVVTSVIFNGIEGGAINAAFTNVYNGPEPDPVFVPVTITKTVVGGALANITPDQFEFIIEEVGGESKKVKTNSAGVYSDEIKFDKDDIGKTFTYRVKEVNGGKKGVVYDTAVHEFKVSVSLSGEEIVAGVSKEMFNSNGIDCSFTNVYKPEVTPPTEGGILVPVIIEKTVVSGGDKEIGPSGFEFVLEWVDDYYESAYCETAVSDINGKATFNLIFHENDIGHIFEYKVYERNDGLEGMKYDDTVYELEIVVYRGEDGKPATTIYLDGKDIEEAENVENTEENKETETKPTAKQLVLKFENEYNVKDENNPETGIAMIAEGTAMMLLSGIMLLVLVLTDKRFRLEK